MKALITGVTGFTGRYMAAELAAHGYEVHGLSHRPFQGELPASIAAIHCCSLNDPHALQDLLLELRPSHVVHLAAVSFVAHADVDAIYQANLIGTRHLLEALRPIADGLAAVILASSANVYGNTSGVLDESSRLAPANDYAVSKTAMEYLARLYESQLPLVITRPFNYTGIGQSEQFLIPKIVAHTCRRAEFIELGNLDIARDFCDVRLVVRAYRRLLETPEAIGQTVNICSGTAHTLQYVLQQSALISGHRLEVRINPAYIRSNDVKNLLRWMIEAPSQRA